MKKNFIQFLVIVLTNCTLIVSSSTTKAQAPQAIPYQAVARNTAGNLIANQTVSLRFSIHDVTINGTVVYKETQSAITNSLGLFMVNIGQGVAVTGTFSGINWSSGSKFIQVEIDAAGGTTYINMGTTQLMSVPYALFAAKTGDLPSGTINGNTMHWNGTTWIADNTIFNDGTKVGIGTTTPTDQFHTTGGVRHESLSGTGSKVVYADFTGKLTTHSIDSVYTNSVSPALAIPDASCTGVTSTITMSNLPVLIPSSLLSVKVNVTHTYDGDLVMYLIAPNGNVLNLSYFNGSSGDNYTNTIFIDSAATSITSGSAPFTGYYKPAGSTFAVCSTTPTVSTFAALGGGTINPNGTWTLVVYDQAGADVGTLNSWSINIPSGTSNSLLPSQAGHANGLLRTDGTNASWTTPTTVKYYMLVQGVFPSFPNGCTSDCLGSIVMWPSDLNFDGAIKPCNGQLLPINQNTALFSLLGTTYGGDGITTFALPNLNGVGRMPVGSQ